jgi:predicted DNA-binding WGR domain protein
MARFYLVDTHPDLFGGVAVLREWGRIGRAGRLKMETLPDVPAANLAAERITTRKLRRGYR